MGFRTLLRELREGRLSVETKIKILRYFWIISLFMLLLGYVILFILLFGERVGITLP